MRIGITVHNIIITIQHTVNSLWSTVLGFAMLGQTLVPFGQGPYKVSKTLFRAPYMLVCVWHIRWLYTYINMIILNTIAKLPESGDTSDDITECDVWKDLAEAEGWGWLFCIYIPVLVHSVISFRIFWAKFHLKLCSA